MSILESGLVIDTPFNIISSLAVHNSIQNFCIPEQRDYQLPVITRIHSSSQHLMQKIIDGAMQEIIPWVLEE